MPNETTPNVKEKAAIYGGVAASGGSVVLLVTALSVLGQHGDEFNLIRNDLRDMRIQHSQEALAISNRLAQLENRLVYLEGRATEVERLLSDPRARPDSFTRSDWNKGYSDIKHWADDRFQPKRKTE